MSRFHPSRADLDDIVQQTVLLALRYEHRFDGKNPLGWLFTILRNVRLSQVRHEKIAREVSIFGEEGEDAFVLPVQGSQLHTMELAQTLTAMTKLPLDQVDAMVLMARGYEAQTAAGMLGCAEGTVKSRAYRGRHRVREMTE